MSRQIRIATDTDSSLIARIGREAFTESFGPFNTAEDLASHLDHTYDAEKIAAEMERGGRYFIAEIEGEPAGFAKLRWDVHPECVPGERPCEVHQLYLLARFHRRGMGTQIMQRMASEALDADADGIFLSVYEKATWAVSFYESIGMQKVGHQVFRVGSDDQTDWLMYRSL